MIEFQCQVVAGEMGEALAVFAPWLAAIIVSLADGAALPSLPPGVPFPAPPDTVADHVITMKVTQTGQEATVEEITLARSGSRLREGDDKFSNFATGTSIQVTFKDGAPERLAASRGDPSVGRAAITREATGDVDVVLGEPCTVFRLTQPVSRSGAGFSCETPDGIQMWTRSADREARAVAVERQSQPIEEMRPAAELFDLATWLRLPSRLDLPPEAKSHDADFEVVLAQTENADPCHNTVTIRRSGAWHYRVEDSNRCKRRVLIFNAVIAITYYAREKDDLGMRDLTIIRMDPSTNGTWHRPRDRPKISSEPEDILGEKCWWVRLSAHASECQTLDGIPLAMSSTRGFPSTLVATSFKRGFVPENDMLPPPDILEWRD